VRIVFRVYGLLSVLSLILWIFCVFDSISAREDEVRNLRKPFWILIVLFFPLAGSIAWLVAGRPQTVGRRVPPWEREQPEFPEYDRPGRAAASTPEADAEFLRHVRERAEEQRRAYREKQAREQPDAEDGDETEAG